MPGDRAGNRMPARRCLRGRSRRVSLLPRSGNANVHPLGAVAAGSAEGSAGARTRARSATARPAPPRWASVESLLSAIGEPKRRAARDNSHVPPLRDMIAEHRPYVRASLRHLGVDRSLLDDAEQDVFLVVLRREHDFDPRCGTSYRGWIWGICRNVASSYRRNARRARREDGALDSAVRPPIEERLAAHEILAALDEGSRAVWLGRCEGRSAQELADTLALPVTTVEWRIRQARDAVRTALRGLVRHANGWVGWVLKPQRGLVSLAVPILALRVLVPSPGAEPAAPIAREHLGSSPGRGAAADTDEAVAAARESAAPPQSNDLQPAPPVAHVEEHEPTVRTVEPRRARPIRRRRASGLVALGDPSVSPR